LRNDVKGKGRVYTELELDNAGRRAYIKISYDSTRNGRFEKTVFGTCDQPQMAEEEYMTPNETIATILMAGIYLCLSRIEHSG
jgi:hypothetical protein